MIDTMGSVQHHSYDTSQYQHRRVDKNSPLLTPQGRQRYVDHHRLGYLWLSRATAAAGVMWKASETHQGRLPLRLHVSCPMSLLQPCLALFMLFVSFRTLKSSGALPRVILAIRRGPPSQKRPWPVLPALSCADELCELVSRSLSFARSASRPKMPRGPSGALRWR